MKQTDNLEGIKSKASVNLLGGLLSSNLKSYKLGDVAEIIISSVDKKTKVGEQKVRLCNFVDVYHNWAVTQSMHESFMIASAKEKDIERLSLKQGYVALTKDSETRDDIGISTYIADNFDSVILGYHCALVKPNEDILLGKYLNAFLHSNYIKKYFELNATGSGMRYTLSAQTLYDIPILLPSLEEQEYIGNVFSTIDRKSALITDIVDYEYLSNINSLPKRKIGDIASIKAGGDCPLEWSKERTEEFNIPIFSNGIENDGLYGYAKQATISKPSVTVAARGTIGFCALREANYVPIIRLLAVTPHDKGGEIYLHQILNRITFKKDGSIQQQLTVPALSCIEIPYPDSIQLALFASKVYPIVEKIRFCNEQNEKLTELRDSLLPLLMNGQVSLNYDLSND